MFRLWKLFKIFQYNIYCISYTLPPRLKIKQLIDLLNIYYLSISFYRSWRLGQVLIIQAIRRHWLFGLNNTNLVDTNVNILMEPCVVVIRQIPHMEMIALNFIKLQYPQLIIALERLTLASPKQKLLWKAFA